MGNEATRPIVEQSAADEPKSEHTQREDIVADGTDSITIRDIDVPFWRIVVIMIKWAIAAIPATIILAILYILIFGLLGALTGGLAELGGLAGGQGTPTGQ